jgi:hypothetical protein
VRKVTYGCLSAVAGETTALAIEPFLEDKPVRAPDPIRSRWEPQGLIFE